MTSWTPDVSKRAGPAYRAIADALATDVVEGRLKEGDRLPTHRALAGALGVTVGTISRAYGEAVRRGLLSGEVGRGTFVRRRDGDDAFAAIHADKGPGVVDLSLNYPVGILEERELAAALAALSRRRGLAGLVEYQPHAGLPQHREAGAAWMRRTGLTAPTERVVVCCGAQHAMAVAFASLARPGDVVLAERLTYPGMRALAGLLGLKLRGLAMDAQGILPEAFEAACRGGARLLYTIPTLQNPTASLMPEARRRRIARIARAHDVLIVEDDIYGLLPEARPLPLAALAPDHTVYVQSLSKTLAPGLRIAYVLAPRRLLERVVAGLRSTTWMASPLLAEIAARWIQDGTGEALLRRRRQETARRQRLAVTVLGRARLSTHPASYHLWLELPEPWRSAAFVASARRRGVAVTPAEVFVVGEGEPPRGVRVCLGAARSREQVEAGLRILASMLESAPEPELSIV